MQILLTEVESLRLLIVYQHLHFADITAQIMMIAILALIGLIPLSFPLMYYAFKLQGFVKYSQMWQPWKKLTIGWVSLVIGGACGIVVLTWILNSGILAQYDIPIVLLFVIMTPLIGCIIITIILTFVGIRQFYKNAKEAVIK
ncbi:MAG: hypothetical protein ACFFDN_04765 [Candidatus Hodarchaeota archaeon]